MFLVDATLEDLRTVVIDDNRHFQTIMRTMLRHFGFRHVEAFADPHQAMTFVTENPIDIAFVDHQMPELTGVEWTRRVRRTTNLANRDMTIIMVTGNADTRMLHSALGAGVDDVLAKPLAPHTLMRHIVRAIGRPRKYHRGAEGYYGPETGTALRRFRQSLKSRHAAPPQVLPAEPHVAPTPARVLPKLSGLAVEIRERPGYDEDALFID